MTIICYRSYDLAVRFDVREPIYRRVTPAMLAAAFGVGAVVAVAASTLTRTLDNWLPNIATELASLALTVVVVQSVMDNTERRRRAPLVEPALVRLGVEFTTLVDAVLHDYLRTRQTVEEPIPRDAIELLDLWLETAESADVPRAPGPLYEHSPEWGTFFDICCTVAAQVKQIDERDMLEPDLIAAIRELSRSTGYARWLRAQEDPGMPPPYTPDRRAHRSVVMAARGFE